MACGAVCWAWVSRSSGRSGTCSQNKVRKRTQQKSKHARTHTDTHTHTRTLKLQALPQNFDWVPASGAKYAHDTKHCHTATLLLELFVPAWQGLTAASLKHTALTNAMMINASTFGPRSMPIQSCPEGLEWAQGLAINKWMEELRRQAKLWKWKRHEVSTPKTSLKCETSSCTIQQNHVNSLESYATTGWSC